MSVIIILLLPLIATALVCIPFKRHWAAGVTVVSCVAVLILVGANRVAGRGGQFRHRRARSGHAEMDCGGRLERVDFAADCVCRSHGGDFLRWLHGA